MYWADRLADQIIKSEKYKPYWVDDMKTPSGRVHIGSVRAFLTHALVYKALKDRGVKVKLSYVFEDHDPFDKLPFYLDEKKFKQYLGKPLYKVPSPEMGFESYGQRWAQEYLDIFNGLGVYPEIIWGSQLYLSGKMNKVVKECLDKADKVREIYKILYKNKKSDNWYPVNVICEKCGKLSTTETHDWDGELVSYRCVVDHVKWTEGCGYEGKISPLNGNAKMPWKVEWPCKWKVIGVTVEGGGKDHMSDGGSFDFARLMCRNVIDYSVPFAVSHEFFLIGGKKMSSSKGVGSSAKEVMEMIPPYLVKFLIVKVRFNQAINFDPNGMTIPDLWDAYDEVAKVYWGKSNKDLARVYELSQVSKVVQSEHFLPRFREVAKAIQDPKIDVVNFFGKVKGRSLTKLEMKILNERIRYAKIWLHNYAPENFVFQISDEIFDEVKNLSDVQKEYLRQVANLLDEELSDPEILQQNLYNLSKELNLPAKDAFGAIYLVLLGKTHGPKVAWLIVNNSKIVREKIRKVIKSV